MVVMQQLSIVDEHDKVIGRADIKEIHEKALLHRAVHVFIIDNEGRLFCRRRSRKKERYPGFWSTSAGAHVMAGQDYDETARSALRETLGIGCRLTMIGKARIKDKWENEISATYVGYSDAAMNFNPKQIECGKFLTVSEIKKLPKQKNVTPHRAHSLGVYLEYKKK